jgi:toxin ParE1/3/4
MALYRLSNRAAADVDALFEYTILNFGLLQARQYLLALHDRFELLALNPMYGRAADDLSPGLRRSEIGSHVAFYSAQEGVVFIARVLHQTMDAKSQLAS